MQSKQAETAAGKWTRRQFVRLSAATVATAPMHRLFASSHHRAVTGFAYATSAGRSGHGNIHVYAIDGTRWTPLEMFASNAPSFSCLSADSRTLYVTNEVSEIAGLPRGAVTAYRIAEDGRLKLLGQKPLSLAAVRPRHMAISPDGGTLAVAATGGGIYNLIALGEDGSLGEIKAIRKETGCGPHRTQAFAQPHTVLFEARSGQLLVSDFGSDRLGIFEMRGDRLVRRQSLSMDAGSGPGSFVVGGKALYVRHMLSGRLDVYGYDAEGGRLREKLQSVAVDVHGGSGMAMHPGGQMLYTCGPHLKAWRIRNDGQIILGKTLEGVAVDRLTPLMDGRTLYALHGESGTIRQIALDESTGEPLAVENVGQPGMRWTSLSVLTA